MIYFNTTQEKHDFAKEVAAIVLESMQGTTPKPQTKFITLKEAAALIGCTPDYLRRPEVRAKFNHFQRSNGRITFYRDSILDFLNGKQ